MLTGPLFVVGMLYVSLVIGRRVLMLCRVRTEATPGEKVVIGGAIGLGMLEFVPFALGALGAVEHNVTVRHLAATRSFACSTSGPSSLPPIDGGTGVVGCAGGSGAWLILLALPVFAAFFDACCHRSTPTASATT